MISARRFRREQQKDEIDRLVVERFEIDGALQSSEQTKESAQFRKLTVRDRHATTDAGRAELFALKQDFQNFLFALPSQLGRARSQFLYRLLLAANLQPCDDGVRRDKISKRHGHGQSSEMAAPRCKGVLKAADHRCGLARRQWCKF